MSNSDSDLSELDDYGYEEDNIEAEQDEGDVSMSDLERESI